MSVYDVDGGYDWWLLRKDDWSTNRVAVADPNHLCPGYKHSEYLSTTMARKPWKEYPHLYWVLCMRDEGRRWRDEQSL